jgi:TolB-like protein/Tfp pilus assembly protein PilF
VIVGLIILNIISRTSKHEILDKSIAILPFRNDSPDKDNTYFINGTMESILNNLSKIKELKVVSRSSVEQFRDTVVSIPDVARRMAVSYVLEGSMQKYGNHIRLTLQLIDKNDNHVWSDQYDREILKIEEHLSLQSEIAQLVAKELQVVISSEEKELIEAIPTTSFSAYDLYLKAKDQHNLYYDSHGENIEALNHAISYYNLILEYDPMFASAYTGLAFAYRSKHYGETYFAEDFLDSTLILAQIALKYDPHLAEAFIIKGFYFRDYGENKRAIEEFNYGLKYNPNSWRIYAALPSIYWNMGNHVKIIESYLKAIELNPGNDVPNLLRNLGIDFITLGMIKLGEEYFRKAYEIDGDTDLYDTRHEHIEFSNYRQGKDFYRNRLEEDLVSYEQDSTLNLGYRIGYAYSVLGDDQKAFGFYKRYVDNLEESEYAGLSVMHRLGYGYWKAGHIEEAKAFFEKNIYQCTESIKKNRPYANRMGAIYDLAGYYAFFGEKERAYEYLDQFLNEINFFGPYWFRWILHDPMFNDIREEARFHSIISQMERKDQDEKARVISWLEENEML